MCGTHCGAVQRVLFHVFLWTREACDETGNAWEVEMPFALTVVYTENAVLFGESAAS